MAEPADGEEFRGRWFTWLASFFLHGRDPSAPPVSFERRRGQSGGHRGIRR
jgi:hypothetical protein